MSLGIQPSLGQINAQAGQVALAFRNAVDGVNNFNAYIQNLGETGLVTNFGFSSGDATALLAMFADLAQVTGVCEGAAYAGPSLPHNFILETVALWGGQ